MTRRLIFPILRYSVLFTLMAVIGWPSAVQAALPATAAPSNHDADLALEMSVDNTQPFVMDEVVYTLEVVNEGSDDATGIVVRFELPPGLVLLSDDGDGSYDGEEWDLTGEGPLEDGERFQIEIRVEVRVEAQVHATASIVALDQTDPDHDNNSAQVTIAPRAQVTFWKNANIEAGTVTSLVSSPLVPLNSVNIAGTLFAGTDGGGVWRSTDGGENWFPTDLQEVFVRGLAVSPWTNALYVVTYGHGTWVSYDFGYSYKRIHDADFVLALALNTYNAPSQGDGDIFIGTDGRGVHYSKSNGDTWSDVTYNLPTKHIRSIVIKKDGAGPGLDRVFVGTQGFGVWYIDYHDDIGRPQLDTEWTFAGLSGYVVQALAVDGLGRLYAGTTAGAFKSNNDGDSWGVILEHLSVRTLLVYVCDTKEYIGLGTDGDYFYRASTTNSAATMTWFNQGLQDRTIYSLHYAAGALFVGTQDHGIHRSDDCGATFIQISNVSLQDAYRVIQALAFSEEYDRLFAGTYGFGVIVSDDLGRPFLNWSRANKGIGNDWIYALEIKDDRYVFAGTWGGGVYRSTDAGENWMFSGLPHRIVYDMAVSPLGVLYAATDRGEVARSVDNGLTWQEIGVAATAIWAIYVDPSDPKTIYAGTFGWGIYKSTDGGFTWHHTGMKTGYVFDFTFGDIPGPAGDPLFAATANGVFYSDDGGDTWTDFSNGLAIKDTRAIAFAGDEYLLAGTWGGGVFLYDPESNAWIRDGLPNQAVTLFAVNEASGEVFVATENDGLYRKKLFTPTATGVDPGAGSETPEGYTLAQNYPNPFNPSTTIGFTLPEAGAVRLAVYDALGREVRVLVDESRAAGSHEATFDARDLPSGVYFYRLQAGGHSFSQKMLLMK